MPSNLIVASVAVPIFLLDCQAIWLVSQSLVAVKSMPSSARSPTRSPTMSETRAQARRTAMLLKGRMVQSAATPSASATATALARDDDATASALARLEQQIVELTEKAHDLGAELSVESAAVSVGAVVKGPAISMGVKGSAVSVGADVKEPSRA